MFAFGILGFWSVEVKPFTPVQVYVPIPPPLSEIVFPAQIIGVLLLAVAVGAADPASVIVHNLLLIIFW